MVFFYCQCIIAVALMFCCLYCMINAFDCAMNIISLFVISYFEGDKMTFLSSAFLYFVFIQNLVNSAELLL